MTKKEEYIVLLDSETTDFSDAIIILEGDGYARCPLAVQLYQEGISDVICFSGGFDDEKSGAYIFEKIKPILISAGISEDSIILEKSSKNTYEQAVEIIKLCKEKNWKRITLVASHYHTYRAFLTFLHEQKKEMPTLILDIASVKNLDWYEETGYGRRIDLLQSEFEKIDLYQIKGNVSSYEEGVEYLRWKHSEQGR